MLSNADIFRHQSLGWMLETEQYLRHRESFRLMLLTKPLRDQRIKESSGAERDALAGIKITSPIGFLGKAF